MRGVDGAFGSSGRTAVGAGLPYALALDANGGVIVVSGTVSGKMELRRFTSAGQPDNAFAGTGVASVDIGDTSYRVALGRYPGILVQSDGAGRVWTESGASDAAVLRFLTP